MRGVRNERAVDQRDVARADDVAAGRPGRRACPGPACGRRAGKISASEYERLLMSSTSGLVHLRSSELSAKPDAAVALMEERVLLAGQVVEDLFVREAAAVVADVEDDAFLVEVVGVEGAQKTIEAGLVHARNVDVAELAVAKFMDFVSVVANPAFVHQVGNLLAAHCLKVDARAFCECLFPGQPERSGSRRPCR